jgi:hypothetical protein
MHETPRKRVEEVMGETEHRWRMLTEAPDTSFAQRLKATDWRLA